VQSAIDPGLESYVQRIVDAAPPLSAAQKDRLAALLRPGGTLPHCAGREAGTGEGAETR
jgi:hypothetical protein